MATQSTLEQTIEILKTPSSERVEIQISFLQQETNQIGLFSQYKEEDGDNQLHRLCCLYMKHEFHRRDQAVFNIGRVGVYIRMPRVRRSELILESNGGLGPIDEEPLQKVKELRAGDSFGELALMKNQKRLASIVCMEDCHFGVIDKKIFNLALKEKEEEKLNSQMRFLANSPIFARINKNIIKILHMNAFYVPYVKNQPVFQEGQPPNACYIIKSGEFTIYKRFEKINLSMEKKKKNEFFTGGTKSFEIKLCVLSKGELFGEQEIMLNEGRRTSAICSSLDGGELMIISRADLEGRVLEDPEHRKTFEAYGALKQKQLDSMTEGVMNQLHKYQNYRFTNLGQASYEVDICEQLKNKDLSAPPEVIDKLLDDKDSNDEDIIQFRTRKPFHVHSTSTTSVFFKNHLPQQQHQSQNRVSSSNSHRTLSEDDQSPLLNQHNHHRHLQQSQFAGNHIKNSKSAQLTLNRTGITIDANNSNSNKDVGNSLLSTADSDTDQYTKHITKHSDQLLRDRIFAKAPSPQTGFLSSNSSSQISGQQQQSNSFNASSLTQQQQQHHNHQLSHSFQQGTTDTPKSNLIQNQQQQQPIMRIELNSYTNLKAGIRKKTAVALSKQYRLPYEMFMAAGRMYDISLSEEQQKLIDQNLKASTTTINQKSEQKSLNRLGSSNLIESTAIKKQIPLLHSPHAHTQSNTLATSIKLTSPSVETNKLKKSQHLSSLSAATLPTQQPSSISMISSQELPGGIQSKRNQDSEQITSFGGIQSMQSIPNVHEKNKSKSQQYQLNNLLNSSNSNTLTIDSPLSTTKPDDRTNARYIKQSQLLQRILHKGTASSQLISNFNYNNSIDDQNTLHNFGSRSFLQDQQPQQILLSQQSDESKPQGFSSTNIPSGSNYISSSQPTSNATIRSLSSLSQQQQQQYLNSQHSTGMKLSQASIIFEKSSRKMPKKVHVRLHEKSNLQASQHSQPARQLVLQSSFGSQNLINGGNNSSIGALASSTTIGFGVKSNHHQSTQSQPSQLPLIFNRSGSASMTQAQLIDMPFAGKSQPISPSRIRTGQASHAPQSISQQGSLLAATPTDSGLSELEGFFEKANQTMRDQNVVTGASAVRQNEFNRTKGITQGKQLASGWLNSVTQRNAKQNPDDSASKDLFIGNQRDISPSQLIVSVTSKQATKNDKSPPPLNRLAIGAQTPNKRNRSLKNITIKNSSSVDGVSPSSGFQSSKQLLFSPAIASRNGIFNKSVSIALNDSNPIKTTTAQTQSGIAGFAGVNMMSIFQPKNISNSHNNSAME